MTALYCWILSWARPGIFHLLLCLLIKTFTRNMKCAARQDFFESSHRSRSSWGRASWVGPTGLVFVILKAVHLPSKGLLHFWDVKNWGSIFAERWNVFPMTDWLCALMVGKLVHRFGAETVAGLIPRQLGISIQSQEVLLQTQWFCMNALHAEDNFTK